MKIRNSTCEVPGILGSLNGSQSFRESLCSADIPYLAYEVPAMSKEVPNEFLTSTLHIQTWDTQSHPPAQHSQALISPWWRWQTLQLFSLQLWYFHPWPWRKGETVNKGHPYPPLKQREDALKALALGSIIIFYKENALPGYNPSTYKKYNFEKIS